MLKSLGAEEAAAAAVATATIEGAINFTTCQHLVVHLNGISENNSPFR